MKINSLDQSSIFYLKNECKVLTDRLIYNTQLVIFVYTFFWIYINQNENTLSWTLKKKKKKKKGTQTCEHWKSCLFFPKTSMYIYLLTLFKKIRYTGLAAACLPCVPYGDLLVRDNSSKWLLSRLIGHFWPNKTPAVSSPRQSPTPPDENQWTG